MININKYGVLTLCATPIGNLDDITLRAIKVFKDTDIIAAEDTRHTKKLLNHLDINKPLESYHEHNKMEKGPNLIHKLKRGNNITLVSDAGTPGISDPGEGLVRLAHKEGIKVTAVPGSVAAIVALVISGQSTRRFSFEGFLPVKKKDKKDRLDKLKKETNTIIIYESPHRIKRTINTLYKAFGNRKITIARELTKKYEEVLKMNLKDAIEHFKKTKPRGEYVIVIAGANKEKLKLSKIKEWEKLSYNEHMDIYINKGISEKEAMKLVAKDRGISKSDVYRKVKIK